MAMAQPVKAIAAKSDGPHIQEGKNRLLEAVLHMYTVAHTYTK